MIKLHIYPQRKKGMSREHFLAHLKDNHGPLFANSPPTKKYVRRYAHNPPLYGEKDTALGIPTAQPERDVISQIWFDDAASIGKLMEEDYYKEFIRPDEDRFADGPSTIIHLTTEELMRDGPECGVKVNYFWKKADALSRDAFLSRWTQQQIPLFLQHQGVRRYLHNPVVPTDHNPFDGVSKSWDAIDELWFDNLAAMAAFGKDKALVEAIHKGARDLLNPGQSEAFVSDFRVLIAGVKG